MASASPTQSPRLDRRTRHARAQGRDARNDLLEAAARVLAERGFREASMDEIAERAGYSKGALYWHFEGKDDLFFALLDERIDRPVLEALRLLRSAPPEHDMAPEASKLMVRLLHEQRDVLLLEHEYWSAAVRDPKLRRRYAKRQAEIRSVFASALLARARHLGTPVSPRWAEKLATSLLALTGGLARDKLIDPEAVPDELLGETFALVYRGLVARLAAGPGAG